METPAEEYDSDSTTIIIDYDSNEEMDVDDDLTPDLIDVQSSNASSPTNSNQQGDDFPEALPLVSDPVSTRNSSSPISLIVNVPSPSIITVSDDAISNVSNIDVPTDNVLSIDERSRSPILNTTQTASVFSQRSTDAQSIKEEPSCSNINQYEEDDGMTCPICFDSWTNIGEHRTSALKCGHLFGLSCISRWITTLKNKNCPTCKKKATKNDIRYIFARKLVSVDDSEVEEMKGKLQEALENERKLQILLTKSVCREHLMINEIRELKNTINFYNSKIENNHCSGNKFTISSLKMYREKSLELCKSKGCRVLSYYERNNLIVASMKSSNSLFPGFGARKIDVLTFKPTCYIPLHSGSIRDMQFHLEQPWLLSVSLDKTLKIVDTTSNVTVTTQNSNNIPLWSCCWDTNDTNAFFIGQQQGSIVKYDIRQPNQPTDTYTIPGDNSPVVSIATITAGSKSPLEDGGIISCKLNSLWVFSNKPSDECSRHFLPIDPPFICARYDNTEPQMLVSTRPNSKVSHTRHHIAKLALQNANILNVDVSHCLTGSTTSKFLSRSCLFSHEGCSYVAAYQESDNIVNLWNTKSGLKVGSVPAHNAILDLCGVNVANSTYLFSLTDSKIDFYKFQ